MGIFDAFTNDPTANQGLLAAAAQILQQSGPSRMPTSFGQILGGGITAGLAGTDAARLRKQEEERAAQLAALNGFKLKDAESDFQNQQIARQQAAKAQQILAARYSGSVPAQQQQQMPQIGSQSQLGVPAAPQSLSQQPAIAGQQEDEYTRLMGDAAALREAGLPMQAKALADEALKYRPEFSQVPLTAKDESGNAFTYVLGKDGTQKRLKGTLPRDEMKLANLGGREVAYNPYALQDGQSFTRTQTPDSIASNAIAMRGQDITMRGQDIGERAAQRTLQQGKIPAGYRMNPDGSMTAIPGGPADFNASKEGMQRGRDANDVLGILDQAESLIKQSTGSYIGAGVDQLGRAVGLSTAGAKAGAQLKVLQGALVSKMPKMSGPQSDKDVQLYREMAGQIGDTTLPIDQRLYAAQTVRDLNEKYAGIQPGASRQGAATGAKTKLVKLDGGGSAQAKLGDDGNYYVERGGKKYRVEE